MSAVSPAPGRAAYAAFLALGALDAAGYGLIAPVVPAIAEETGASVSVAGLLVATFGVGMLAAFQPAGAAIQRVGARPVLAFSLGLMALGAVPFVVSESLPLYFAGRLLMGFGSGGLWSAISLGVIERWPGNEYRRLSGVMATYSVGGVAGPALGSIGGIRAPFLAYLGCCAIGAVAIRLVGAPHQHAPELGSDRAVLRHPSFVVSLTLMTLVAVTIGTLDGVLPLHFDSELGQAGIAALFVGTSAIVATFAVVASRLPLRPTAFVAAAFIVAGLAAAGAGDEVWMWIAALAVAAMGFGLAETVSLGYLLDATGPERIMLALVVWNLVFGVGYLLGPSLGGLVADNLGFAAVGLVPLAAGAVFLWSILRAARVRAREARQEA